MTSVNSANVAPKPPTPKLTPKAIRNLTQLKIARDCNSGNTSPVTPRATDKHKLPAAEDIKSSERSKLINPPQKIVITPAGKSEGKGQVKVTVGGSSSDSSDGKRTPPKKAPPVTSPLKKKRVARSCTWKPPGSGGGSPSLRSLKSGAVTEGSNIPANASWASFTFTQETQNCLRPLSDVVSVRSLASIGMGSTDGRKLTIRRVPTSPTELLNLANPNT